MMIQGISTLSTLYQRYSSPKPVVGRMAIPVKPGLSSFAMFKHILGVPAHGQNQTVPFYKLRILDSLIDRIIRMNKDSNTDLSFEKLDNEKVDGMIQTLQSRISGTNSISGYSTALPSETGSIIDLLA